LEYVTLVGQESTVGIATHYGQDGAGGGGETSAHVQTSPGDHPASHTMGTRSFLKGEVARAWH